MSATDAPVTPTAPEGDVLHRLSTLDRFLPVWIIAAMMGAL